MTSLRKLAIHARVLGSLAQRSLFSTLPCSGGASTGNSTAAMVLLTSCPLRAVGTFGSLRMVHSSGSRPAISQAKDTAYEKSIEEMFNEGAEEAEGSDIPYGNSQSRGEKSQQQAYSPKRKFASGVNRVELLGGVAGDPIVTVARNGVSYANFRMFTNVPVLKKNGEWNELVEVHNVSAFSHLCNYVKNNITKGTRVYVSGRLHYLPGNQQPDGKRGTRVAFVKAEVVQAIAVPKRPPAFEETEADRE